MKKIDEKLIYVLIDIDRKSVPSLKQIDSLMLSEKYSIQNLGLKTDDQFVYLFDKDKGAICQIKNIDKIAADLFHMSFYAFDYVKIVKEIDFGTHTRVKIKKMNFKNVAITKEKRAYIELLKEKAYQFVSYMHNNINPEMRLSLSANDNLFDLTEIILSFLNIEKNKKNKIVFQQDLAKRAKMIIEELEKILIVKQEKVKISKKVQKSITENQKKYYLNEQLKIIKQELGFSGNTIDEYREFKKKIENAKMPENVRHKAMYELNKLNTMNIMSPEATVIRNYLDWIINIPWYKMTKDNLNIKLAEKILDKNHYGLKKVKERVLEYLAVIKLSNNVKGQILCFSGPPGVGKTSLGKSIAEAMGREFVRISLGGVKDEAEIRGHRKTYIGSLPGKIIQMMRRAGVKNPVFVLDEVDKLGSDFRGDPSSALLEVLDPELNSAFMDHYLEIEYDLSNVLFICTANVIHTIPAALRDRMEIINLPGYLEFEKFQICKTFLIPKTLKNSGLKRTNIKIEDHAISELIRNYTRESGVRNLEKQIAKIMRKIAKDIAIKNNIKKKYTVNNRNIKKYLGPVSKQIDKNKKSLIGVAKGLAWTQVGGDVLSVETLIFPGTGKIQLTGKLGDVLKESANASISYLRKYANKYKIDKDFYKKYDIHIHLPEGAIPKDGPSAGITITMSLFSALKNIPLDNNFAMTGEITLRGIILPIGGLAEKIVAAQSVGIENVIIPYQNKPQYDELPNEAKKDIKIFFIKSIDEALKILFN